MRRKRGQSRVCSEALEVSCRKNEAPDAPLQLERSRQNRAVPADYEDRMSDEFKTIFEFPGYIADNMSRIKANYANLALPRDQERYGWVRPV